MLRRITLAIALISLQTLLIAMFSTAADEPKLGENLIWVDLGEENEGLLLTQEEQGDGITEPATKLGVDCRENPWPYGGPGHNHMYFRIDDGFLLGGKHKAWIVMEYFDSLEAQEIDCQYDSNGAGPVNGAFRGAGDGAFLKLQPEGTDEWRVHMMNGVSIYGTSTKTVDLKIGQMVPIFVFLLTDKGQSGLTEFGSVLSNRQIHLIRKRLLVLENLLSQL